MGSRYGTWAKVPAIREFLEHYQFVVFLDADVILTYPHLPLEWLFNYWAMHPQTLVAMAADPTEPVNDDERGNTFLNTGFVIAQRSVRTMELLRAWENCPGESQYQNCAHWVTHWPHEQGAFGTYLRYDFNRSSDIKVLPCAEANGCPNAAHTGCVGKFVRHYWYSKNSVTPAVDQSIQRYFLPYLHHAFLRDAQLDVLALEPENMAQD
ncbi:Galactosyl transferase [Penicillium chermesinum]|nr:Galactosyl transferase [Penicillium chermesinum]